MHCPSRSDRLISFPNYPPVPATRRFIDNPRLLAFDSPIPSLHSIQILLLFGLDPHPDFSRLILDNGGCGGAKCRENNRAPGKQ